MNGIVVVDKSEGWTSMDVCARLRGVFHERRIGHGGTLDPMATGVLPVFVGRATRAVSFATESDKEYLAQIKLGVITDTQDMDGEILQRREVSVPREDLEAVLCRFRGPQEQIPPMYSAIRIQGKRLYELARKGQEVERAPRHVVISELEITDCIAPDTFGLRIRCSKGTYVRTLCHDIGQALGCGGCMAALRRSMAAGFSLEDAVPLEQLVHSETPQMYLRPVDTMFRALPALQLPPAQEVRIRNGCEVPVGDAADGDYRVYGAQDSFLALGRVQGGRLRALKSFFEVPRGPGGTGAREEGG